MWVAVRPFKSRKWQHHWLEHTGTAELWNQVLDWMTKAGTDLEYSVVKGGPCTTKTTNSCKQDSLESAASGLQRHRVAPYRVGKEMALLVPGEHMWIDLTSPCTPFTSNEIKLPALSKGGRRMLYAAFQNWADTPQETPIWNAACSYPGFFELISGRTNLDGIWVTPNPRYSAEIGRHKIGDYRINPADAADGRPDAVVEHVARRSPSRNSVSFEYWSVENKTVLFKDFDKFETINMLQIWQTSLVALATLTANAERKGHRVVGVTPLLVLFAKDRPGYGRWYRFTKPSRRGPGSTKVEAAGEFTLTEPPPSWVW